MRSAAMTLAAAACLSACADRGPPSTMTLVRKGDASACVANDIEDGLRHMIMPEGHPTTGKRYTIAFTNTTMKRFDEPIAKMTCNASVRITGPGNTTIADEALDYTIAPSARDQDAFVISSSTLALRTALSDHMADMANSEAEWRDEQAAAEAMRALVKPAWLIGRWVQADAGSSACLEGPYVTFFRSGRIESTDGMGRWKLEGLSLAMTFPNRSMQVAITEADTNRVVTQDDQGATAVNRRCTAADKDDAEAASPTSLTMDDAATNLEVEADKLPDLINEP